MPLVRKSQVLAQVEGVPATEVSSFVAGDYVQVLDATITDNRSKIESNPASANLSNIIQTMGRGTRQLAFTCDARGTGTPTTPPDYGKFLEASGYLKAQMSSLTFNGSFSLIALRVGTVLKNAGSARAVVLFNYAAGETTVVVWLDGLADFADGDAITTVGGTAVGTLASSTAVGLNTANGLTYHCTSICELQLTTTGSWSGTAIAGDTVTVTSGGYIVGGFLLTRNPATTTTYFEYVWGSIPASGTLVSSSGGTATIHGTPAIAQLKTKSLSIRHNRAGLSRVLYGAKGTWTLNGDAGNTAKWGFTMTGKLGTNSDIAFTASVADPSTVPPKLVSGFFNLNGILIPTKSVAWDAGNTVIMRSDANQAEGDVVTEITGRAPKCTITLDQVGKLAFDHWAKRDASTGIQIGQLIGTAQGNRVSVCAPNAQITEISDADQEGVATHAVTFECQRLNSDGDDEVIISYL
jgi:hypothetical protein